jgi:hypothetical protein
MPFPALAKVQNLLTCPNVAATQVDQNQKSHVTAKDAKGSKIFHVLQIGQGYVHISLKRLCKCGITLGTLRVKHHTKRGPPLLELK